MGFMSPVEKIDGLRIYSIRDRKVYKPERLTRFGQDFLFTQKDDATVYYTGRGMRGCYILGGAQNWVKSWMNALVRLKAITRAEAEAHLKANKARAEENELKDDQKELAKMLKKYGLKAIKLKARKPLKATRLK